MFARVIYPVVDRGNSVPVLFNKRSARMFGPLPVPGRGLEGERGIILGEEKCTPRAKRGGVVYGFSNGERVVLLPAATGMITRINCIVTKGEGRARLAPIIVKSNLEPWLAARFLLLYLNFSFHSCAGIILRRDVEGGGEKIRRLNDSDRSLTRYGKKENIVIG